MSLRYVILGQQWYSNPDQPRQRPISRLANTRTGNGHFQSRVGTESQARTPLRDRARLPSLSATVAAAPNRAISPALCRTTIRWLAHNLGFMSGASESSIPEALIRRCIVTGGHKREPKITSIESLQIKNFTWDYGGPDPTKLEPVLEVLEEWSDLLKHADIAAFFETLDEEEHDCSPACPAGSKISAEFDVGGPQP
ncbi:MAG: hypothetical protein AAFO17_15915 [Pseudomonadota bacterium]